MPPTTAAKWTTASGVGAQVSQHSRDLGSPSKVVVPTAEPQGGRTCLLQLLGDVAAENPVPPVTTMVAFCNSMDFQRRKDASIEAM